MLANNILRRHSSDAPEQRTDATNHPPDLQSTGESRADGQPEKVYDNTSAETGISGFSVCSISMKLTIHKRKIKQGARKILDQQTMSVKEIAQFVGRLLPPGEQPLQPLCTTGPYKS